ncbi:hypothetical protein BSQ44_06835 [Aquibium oceanicum]|uniref:Uncharacterized protein n=1 Tax=Aquibium oceanicum TaxID=1670800 RepID=A0A1L3SNY5_9HYPH|nr:hypothetical protein BSQ44_06835 [Aquibium oceanicum]
MLGRIISFPTDFAISILTDLRQYIESEADLSTEEVLATIQVTIDLLNEQKEKYAPTSAH